MNYQSENPVVAYMKKFLASDSKRVMEHCFLSIKDESGNRIFKQSLESLDDSSFDSFFPLVSIVILTANKIECDSLNYIVSKQKNSIVQKRRHSLQLFENSYMCAPDAYLLKIESFYILHLNAYETGANTPGGSTDLVRFVSNQNLLQPVCIVSFGICYGRDPKKQNIGDVIIPRKLYPWSIGQKISEKNFKIKHDDFNLWLEEKFAETGIYSLLRDFCNGEDGIIRHEAFLLDDGEYAFSINTSLGNLSTGEAVVSSSNAKKLIREAARNEEELGGEMEGYGLAKECIFYAKTPCFIIKSICDWGELKNIDQVLEQEGIKFPQNLKDKLQAYAAFCAGITLIRLLNQEKNVLLTPKIVKWMGEMGKTQRMDIYNYVDKDSVIKKIKHFYSTDDENADQILAKFIQSDIIQVTKNSKYHINPHLWSE